MRYKYRFVEGFGGVNKDLRKQKRARKIISVLEENNHSYVIEGDMNGIIVEMFSDSEIFDEIYAEFKGNALITIGTEYTKQEFKEASWFKVWSNWRFDYPIVDNLKGQKTFNKDNICPECKFGEEQTGSYIFKKSPKWGRDKYFCSTNWSNTLFISNEGIKLLEDAGIKGYHLVDVLKNRTMEPFEDFSQIYIESKLEKGYIEKDSLIKSVEYCDVCKQKRIITNGKECYFKKKIFDNIDVDFIQSYEWFGSFHIIIISKRLYEIIMKNKMGRNLVIEPLFLVD